MYHMYTSLYIPTIGVTFWKCHTLSVQISFSNVHKSQPIDRSFQISDNQQVEAEVTRGKK